MHNIWMRRVMRKYNLTIAFLLSLLCCYFTTPIHSALTQPPNIPISSQGTVVYDDHNGLILKYFIDFEDVTKIDDYSLSIPIDHWFNTQGEGGASFWMEGLDRSTPGVTAHSGSRCVGMELTDITKSRRNQLEVLNMYTLVGDEVFISVWYYLPADWDLYAPLGPYAWERWYSIANPMVETNPPNYHPYLEMPITHNEPEADFKVVVELRDVNGQQHMYDEQYFGLPRGRWFNVQWYLKRHETDGAWTLWMDGKLISDHSGIQTKAGADGYHCCPAKIYYEPTDPQPHYLWFDDLEIYGAP